MGIAVNETVVGTCGHCGGPVVKPDSYMSTMKPIPQCKRCGATPKQDYGPRMPMNPAPQIFRPKA